MVPCLGTPGRTNTDSFSVPWTPFQLGFSDSKIVGNKSEGQVENQKVPKSSHFYFSRNGLFYGISTYSTDGPSRNYGRVSVSLVNMEEVSLVTTSSESRSSE